MRKPTLIDRAIASVAPLHAAKRMAARAQYEALSVADMAHKPETSPVRRFWNVLSRDARRDTLPQLGFDRAASRELVRTNAIAAGLMRTNVDRIVGTGLALVAQPDAKVLGWTPEQATQWKARTQAEFSMWSDAQECDLHGELNFYELQALVLRSVLESGDSFTLLPDGSASSTNPYRLKVQVLEADRVGNPGGEMDTSNMAAGVRLNKKTGAPDAYYVLDKHPGAGLFTLGEGGGQWVERVAKSGRLRILHHYHKRRPGMVRGVPYLAPVVDCIKQLGRYSEAEITAAVISAYLTVFIETPTGDPAPPFAGDEAPEGSLDVALGQGAVVGLAAGEKANMINPMRPNPNFQPFIEGVIKQIGVALGVPFELILKQFNASYSASKAALLDAWIYFRGQRYWLANSFCQPVYETWLAEAVATGRIAAPGFFRDPLLRWAYTRAAWHGDSMGSIDPQREVAAYRSAIEGRLMTQERATWELFGNDWNGIFDQMAQEQSRMAAAGILPVPKAGAAAPQQTQKPDNDKDEENA